MTEHKTSETTCKVCGDDRTFGIFTRTTSGDTSFELRCADHAPDGMDVTEYATEIECPNGHQRFFAHTGPWVPIDHQAPWPNVHYCPECGEPYPDDLGTVITEVREITTTARADIPPAEREDCDE